MDKRVPATGGETCILVYDDNQIFLEAITGLLSRQTGAQIIGTTCKESALACAQDYFPALVLIDMDMPDAQGIQAINQMRIMLPESKIIAMSLLLDSGFRMLAISAGADDLADKTELHEQIDLFCRQQTR